MQPDDIVNREFLSRGMLMQEYAGRTRNYRRFLQELLPRADADKELVAEFKTATKNYTKPLTMTVNTEDWCGDWVCNAPILHSFCEKADINFRIFRGSENPEFKHLYEKDGDDHIPAVSLWDGDGKEILRWIEAPSSVEDKKIAYKEEHPEFMQTYRQRDSSREMAKAWAKMYREFLEEMAGWYSSGNWRNTLEEIVAKAQKISV